MSLVLTTNLNFSFKCLTFNEIVSPIKILYFDELYLCGRNNLLAFICNLKSENEVLIIGHNFGISELASYLIGKQVVMKTCGFISMEFPGFSVNEISASTGILKSNHRCTIDY